MDWMIYILIIAWLVQYLTDTPAKRAAREERNRNDVHSYDVYGPF